MAIETRRRQMGTLQRFICAATAMFMGIAVICAPSAQALARTSDTGAAEGLVAPVSLTPRSGSSTVGVDWHRQANDGTAGALSFSGSGIAYGNGYFVAVRSQTNVPSIKVARSTDGRVWTEGPDAFSYLSTASWRGVAFGGGVFVAVASGGQIMTSVNGLNWTARTPSDGGEAWMDVAYGNGTFVAFGANGYPRYSVDGGITWTRSALQAIFGSFGDEDALVFGNGIFVAVTTNYSYTSADGITWASSDNIASKTGGYHYGGLAYGAGKWIALPSDSRFSSSVQGSLYSSDALTWTAVSPVTNVPGKCFNAVTYGAGLFVAFSCSAPAAPAAIISADGTGWTSVITGYPGSPVPLPAVTFGDGMFVAVAVNAVYTSQSSPAITGISPSSGPTPGGRTITISGTALQNTTAVTINGTAATSFANVSSTEITAVVPAGTAGTATIGVTTWGGSTTSTAFTYVTPPVVTSLNPSSAPTTGGRTIVVTGTDLANTTAVTVGGVTATGIVNTSNTQVSFVSPAGAAGSQDVVLTTEGGGSFTLSGGLTNVVPPVVASLTPALGFDSGGTLVTISGTNLANTTGVTVGGAAATNVTNVSDTQITFTTPAGSIGTSDLIVTTAGGGSATSSGAFRYIGQPTITSVSPVGGPTTGGTSVVITGTNLGSASSVTMGGAAATVTANTATSVTVTAPSGASGSSNVVVQTWNGAATVTSINSYTYATPPTIASFSPTVSLAGGGGTVTLTGSNLTDTTTVTIEGNPATNVIVVSATQITFTVPAGTAGTAALVVTTALGGTASSAVAFRYINAPTITSISPVVGPVAGGTTVTVTGTNLDNTTSVSVGGVAGTTITNITSTSVSFVTAASGIAGSRDVILQTYSGVGSVTASAAFRYVSAPTITAVSPNGGPVAGGTSVTITGTNLTNTTSITFGSTPAASFANISDTQVTAVAPAHAANAAQSVTVQTYDGAGAATLSSAYAFVAAPTVTELSATTGLTSGGTIVTVTGADLANTTGVTVGGASATGLVNVSGTSIRFTTPAGVSGQRDVVITTSFGGSATATNAFRYIDAPTITSVTPAAGLIGGGSTIDIVGTNLINVTSVTVGGVAATVTANTGTSVTVTTPAGTAGAVSIAVQTYSGAGTVTSANAFTYVNAPTITSLTPAAGTVGGGQVVTLTGTNLANTTVVTVGSTNVASLVNVNGTTVQFVVPAGTVGLRDVTLTTAYGGSVTANGAFRYIQAPTVSGVNPNIGPSTGGTSVTVTGANLTNVTQVNVGGFIGTVTANTADSLTFTTSPATSSGLKNITIQTYSGAGTEVVSNAFTYVNPPTISAVTPALGLVSGGTSVTISGTNLLNATSVTFGGVAATVTATTATALTVTTAAATAGAKDVVVTTNGGGSVTSQGAFTFVGEPTITSVSPNAGPTTGGVAATISGTNLGSATSVTIGGSVATVIENTSTSITVVTPAGAQGSAAVVVQTQGGVGSVTANAAYAFVTPPTLTSISPTGGSAGTVITLTGSALLGTTAVTVGTQVAAFTVVGDSTVTVAAPGSLTGSRVVVLTTPGGSVVATQLFVYPDPPAPSPDSGASASGTTGQASTPIRASIDLGPNPPAVPLTAGQESVLVNGQRIPANLSANPTNTGVILSGEGWGLSLGSLSSGGTPIALGSNGALALSSGGRLPLGASGYAPGTDATVFLMSTPQLLGVFQVAANGTVAGTIVLPAGMPEGQHTLQVNGVSSQGQVRSISLGVDVISSRSPARTVGSRVLFEYRSAILSAQAKRSLKAMVAQIPARLLTRGMVIGALRAGAPTPADRVLARQRAENVTAFIRKQGVTGPITTTVRTVQVSQKAQDRHVSVTMTWTGEARSSSAS